MNENRFTPLCSSVTKTWLVGGLVTKNFNAKKKSENLTLRALHVHRSCSLASILIKDFHKGGGSPIFLDRNN